MPPAASESHSCELDNLSKLPETPDDLTLGRMFSITDSQRAKNYAHNMAQVMPSNALDENGMIIDQEPFNKFVINNYDVRSSGCGAIALYNAAKILDSESKISLPQAINWMEPYGVLNNTFGAVPTGISHAFNQMGYETQYCFSRNPADVSAAAAQADAAVIFYVTTRSGHYVAFQPDPVVLSSNGQQPQTFTFYNQKGEANDSRTFEEFSKSLSSDKKFIDALLEGEKTQLGQIVILLNKPK